MAKRTTIKDIAADCEVSLSTVSLVLNNSTRISEPTRARVKESVRKHNYQPNVQARALVSQASRVISVTIPALQHVFADIYFGEIVSGIYDEATEQGYKLLLDIARDRFIESREYMNLLETRRADGMLFIGSSIDDTYLLEFAKEDHPFLLVNHYFPQNSLNYIAADYAASARIAAEHLLGHGHRSIGLIVGTNTHTGRAFKDAFLQRLTQAGIPPEDQPWEESEWDEQGGYLAAEKLLERRPDLTAIMGANDRIAIGAIRLLNLQDRNVPHDLSVMGMDNIPAARFTTPGLTTISLDLYQIGRKSCGRLLEMIRNAQFKCHELMPTQLVERESTGPARRG